MIIFREFSLRNTTEDYRLYQEPVAEMKKRRTDSMSWKNLDVADTLVQDHASVTKEFELLIDFSRSRAEAMGYWLTNLESEWLKVGQDQLKNIFFIERNHAGDANFSGLFAAAHRVPFEACDTLTIMAPVDEASIECMVGREGWP